MGKLLSWVLLIAIGYLVYRLLVVLKRKSLASAAGRPGARPAPHAHADGEAMVRCERCGVYLPRSEAVDRGDRHYCSLEHRDAG